MTNLDCTSFSAAEKAVYTQTMKFLNEMTFIKNTTCRKKNGKKLKGLRKKVKTSKIEKESQKAKLVEVFEAILGTFKLKMIDYLKVVCSSKEIKGWIDKVTETGADYFVQNARESMCREVVNIISQNHIFRVPLEVHRWFFKSGILRSEKKDSEGITSKYSDEVLLLRNKYTKKSQIIINSLNLEELGLKKDTACLDSEIIILKEIQITYEALKSVLSDMKYDDSIFSRLKNNIDQIEALNEIMLNFINETSEDIKETEKVIKNSIKNSSYQNRFSPFKEFLNLSCRMTGIRFQQKYEEWFINYYESLKNYSEEELRKELKWLRQKTVKVC